MTDAEQQVVAKIGKPVERIAIFRALYLGDLLLAVPAFRALRAGFPDAEITFIGLPWAESFVERFAAYIDRFLPFPGYPGIAEVDFDPDRTDAFLQEQREYGYDLVIQMHGSGVTSNPFALDLGGRATAAYVAAESLSGLTFVAPYPDEQPEVERNLGLARLLGCPADDARLEFPLTSRDRAEAEMLLGPSDGNDRPRVGLHPGAKFPSRRWMPERFAAVADEMIERHDASVLITGGPGEIDIACQVAARMRHEPLLLAGETSLGGLAAVIAELDLFISNDTGPSHIATALDVPSIAIFGPADVQRWAASESDRRRVIRNPVPCSPCVHDICPIDHRCLTGITPEQVRHSAEELLVRETRRRTAVACAV